MVKRDGVILEKTPSLRVKRDGVIFEKIPHQPQGDRSSYFLFFTLQKKCQVLKIGSLRASAG